MFLTSVLLAKQKSRYVLVKLRSMGSGLIITKCRKREDLSKGKVMYDYRLGRESLFVEVEKLRAVK